jgi:hypothetical protein
MFPFTCGADFVFYKNPGSIPVKGGGGGTPGIIPGKIEVDPNGLGGSVAGNERNTRDYNVIGITDNRKAQRSDE